MTEDGIKWLAGILEGEGSFSFSRNKSGSSGKARRKLRIRLSMTDLDIILRVRNVVDPHMPVRRDERSQQQFKDGYKRKDTYLLSIEGGKAEFIMREILPYMGNRRSQRINECLLAYNDRRGPVYIPPTDEELRASAEKLADLGLK